MASLSVEAVYAVIKSDLFLSDDNRLCGEPVKHLGENMTPVGIRRDKSVNYCVASQSPKAYFIMIYTCHSAAYKCVLVN